MWSGTHKPQLDSVEINDDEEYVWERQPAMYPIGNPEPDPIRTEPTLQFSSGSSDEEIDDESSYFATFRNIFSGPKLESDSLQRNLVKLQWTFNVGQDYSKIHRISYVCSKPPSQAELKVIREKIGHNSDCASLTLGRSVYVSEFSELVQACLLRCYNPTTQSYQTFDCVKKMINSIHPTITKVDGPEITVE